MGGRQSYERTADGEYKFLDEILNNIPEGSPLTK